MSETHFPGTRRGAAADKAGGGNGVVRGPKRTRDDGAPCRVEHAGHRMHGRDLECFRRHTAGAKQLRPIARERQNGRLKPDRAGTRIDSARSPMIVR